MAARRWLPAPLGPILSRRASSSPKQNWPAASVAEAGAAASAPPAPSSSGTPVLEVRHLGRSLPLGGELLEILRDVNFSIHRGEFVTLAGPSGSGKSTLLGCITGMDSPTTGQVLLNGLTARENVEVPLYAGNWRGSPADRAQELLGLVGLSHRLEHRPSQLSGGEQQRVAIARALATEPPLLVADEPTGNLAAAQGKELLELLWSLRERLGTTLVIATHDRTVGGYATRWLQLADGELTSDSPGPRAGSR